MKEKNVTKVSLSTFLLIIAIIAIIVMGVFIYKLNNDKTAEIKKSTELQAQVNSLNGIVSDLQEKIDDISKTINSNNSSKNATVNNSEKNTITDNNGNTSNTSFTDEQVKECLANYLELEQTIGDSILDKLTKKGVLNYNSSDNTEENYVITTKIKFSEYKKAMLNYVSESEFEKNWTRHNFDVDNNGYITFGYGLGGGICFYTISNITKTTDNSYIAKTSYTVEHMPPSYEKNFTLTVTSYNEKCVIDSLK